MPQNDPNVPINPRNTTVSPLYTCPQSQTFGQFKNFKLNLLKTTLILLKSFCHIRAEMALDSQERLEIQINLKLLYTKPGESNDMRYSSF